MTTPHIEAKNADIAKTVLMPGDPLRAKFIAENFLENAYQFNSIRNMLGYTGVYKENRISVMGSGMGMPSIGIYSHELFNFYSVENIIRVGSCGAYSEDLRLYDVILGKDAWTDSNYGQIKYGFNKYLALPSKELNKKLEKSAKELGIELKSGRIHSTDIFYRKNFEGYKKIKDNHHCTVVEMESYALFLNAEKSGKKAASLLTVSDLLFDLEKTISSDEREKAFTGMMEIALNSIK